jgi:hypothetical protein
MSNLKEPSPGKLFLSVLFKGGEKPEDTEDTRAALAVLQDRYGKIDVLSPILPFNYTQYYQKEMGFPLWRRILSFERLVSRETLVEAKLFCMRCETNHLDSQGNRWVNLDPGILTVENLILATGKNHTHRVYLDRGVFADLTLLYRQHRFEPLPWTYPDYASQDLEAYLLQMRQRLLDSVKRQEVKARLR